MRQLIFKMEREGLCKEGDILPVTEGKLPTSVYYTLGKSYAMSENIKPTERLKSTEGKVIKVEAEEAGFSVTVEFDE